MTNWAQYRPSTGAFTPDNIDPFLCTHVIYSLATINSFNQLSPIEWNDEQQYGRLNSLKNVWVYRVKQSERQYLADMDSSWFMHKIFGASVQYCCAVFPVSSQIKRNVQCLLQSCIILWMP